jgi:uncharacterized delta-60 repeat protein
MAPPDESGFSGFALLLVLPLGVAPAADYRSGTLDPSFGTGGRVTTAIGSGARANALAIQKDGKLVAAGFGYDNCFALVRYNADGTLDRSFGWGGQVRTAVGSAYAPGSKKSALVIQKDGKLVAAGLAEKGSHDVFALVRYRKLGDG